VGLFSKEEINKGGDKQGKSDEKRISRKAFDINKQTIYTAPKSKIESRAHHAPEPTRGNSSINNASLSPTSALLAPTVRQIHTQPGISSLW